MGLIEHYKRYFYAFCYTLRFMLTYYITMCKYIK
jgi:hypothetical protein